ncbi:hypothetical protein B0H11DRAFT_586100 [Mycena galericulata]|nr:hypothetical protein B0H11DRAFT_586100 [Mycena galericulata]
MKSLPLRRRVVQMGQARKCYDITPCKGTPNYRRVHMHIRTAQEYAEHQPAHPRVQIKREKASSTQWQLPTKILTAHLELLRHYRIDDGQQQDHANNNPPIVMSRSSARRLMPSGSSKTLGRPQRTRHPNRSTEGGILDHGRECRTNFVATCIVEREETSSQTPRHGGFGSKVQARADIYTPGVVFDPGFGLIDIKPCAQCKSTPETPSWTTNRQTRLTGFALSFPLGPKDEPGDASTRGSRTATRNWFVFPVGYPRFVPVSSRSRFRLFCIASS